MPKQSIENYKTLTRIELVSNEAIFLASNLGSKDRAQLNTSIDQHKKNRSILRIPCYSDQIFIAGSSVRNSHYYFYLQYNGENNKYTIYDDHPTQPGSKYTPNQQLIVESTKEWLNNLRNTQYKNTDEQIDRLELINTQETNSFNHVFLGIQKPTNSDDALGIVENSNDLSCSSKAERDPIAPVVTAVDDIETEKENICELVFSDWEKNTKTFDKTSLLEKAYVDEKNGINTSELEHLETYVEEVYTKYSAELNGEKTDLVDSSSNALHTKIKECVLTSSGKGFSFFETKNKNDTDTSLDETIAEELQKLEIEAFDELINKK